MEDGQRDGQEEIRVVEWERTPGGLLRPCLPLSLPRSLQSPQTHSLRRSFSCPSRRVRSVPVRLVRPTLCLRRDALVACLMPARDGLVSSFVSVSRVCPLPG